MNYLDSLNPAQKEAVLHTEGPLLILAGAGAGKTKTITHRILHLIHQGVAPHNILAITFTNKAAKEMRERLEKMLSSEFGSTSDPAANINGPVSLMERPFVSTFHSLGVRIIKENAERVGILKNFTILDRDDSIKSVRQAVEAEGLDPKQYDPAKFQKVISREKGNFVTIEAYERIIGKEYYSNLTARVWKRYEANNRKENSLDFDDLLAKAALLLRDHPDIRERYQKLWKYVHIDEYQDTNGVQYNMSKMLAEQHHNICAVGDIDQNIYSWRGADIKNILDFEKDYPDARVIKLEENYRSTKTILETANAVIRKNKHRREKNLFTNNGHGEKISLFDGYDEIEEAHFIAYNAKQLIASGVDPEEIAVLYRANFQSRVIEDACLKHEVPYVMLGTRFFERREVRDALAYARAALNPASIADVKRAINTPARGIGKVTLLKVLAGEKESIGGKAGDAVQRFFDLLERIGKKAANEPASSIMRYIVTESGLEAAFKTAGTGEDLERIENLQELVSLATKYDYLPAPQGLEKLIEDAALESDQDGIDARRGIKLMTIHASKGLEFQYVFITGLEEDLFPHRRLNEDSLSDGQAEEERRLFYVALTRAKKKLFLTMAGMRTIFGSKRMNVPSEFLGDLDEALLEKAEYDGPRPEREPVIYI